MAKKPHQPQGDLLAESNLKKHGRSEEDKFPPVGENELRTLKKVWTRSLAEARHPHRIPPPYASPYPGIRPSAPASHAIKAHKHSPENLEHTRQSQDYWTSYRKCAACPGPNRRQGKSAFGQGPNTGHTPDGEPT